MPNKFFKGLGMTLSAGINVYLKMVWRQKRIPFVLSMAQNDDAWSEFKQMAEDSSFENGLLDDQAFHRGDSGVK